MMSNLKELLGIASNKRSDSKDDRVIQAPEEALSLSSSMHSSGVASMQVLSAVIKKEPEPIPFDQKIVGSVREFLEESAFIHFKGKEDVNPLSVKAEKIGRFFRFSLQTEIAFHLDTIEILDRHGKDIGLAKNTIISSVYGDDEKHSGPGVLKSKKNGGCGFHTKHERNPWLIVDLNKAEDVSTIVVYNCEGMHYSRSLSLKIEISNDLHQWETVFDNLSFVNDYNQGNVTEQARALILAGILQPEFPQAFLRRLKKDQPEDAVTFLYQVNELVREKQVALGPHGFMRTFELQSEEDKNILYQELGRLLKLMNSEFGVPTFISSGTLLGIVRDGQLIEHDDDVDICYISNATEEQTILNERQKLVEFLGKNGCRLVASGAAHYWCTTSGGLKLDIFTGFIEQGKCSMNPLGRATTDLADVLPLVPQEIHGTTLMLPKNPDALLGLNYGENWRVPDPLWTFDWRRAEKDFKFLYF